MYFIIAIIIKTHSETSRWIGLCASTKFDSSTFRCVFTAANVLHCLSLSLSSMYIHNKWLCVISTHNRIQILHRPWCEYTLQPRIEEQTILRTPKNEICLKYLRIAHILQTIITFNSKFTYNCWICIWKESTWLFFCVQISSSIVIVWVRCDRMLYVLWRESISYRHLWTAHMRRGEERGLFGMENLAK